MRKLLKLVPVWVLMCGLFISCYGSVSAAEGNTGVSFKEILGGFAYDVMGVEPTDVYVNNAAGVNNMLGTRIMEKLEKDDVDPYSVIVNLKGDDVTWEQLRTSDVMELFEGTDTRVQFRLNKYLKQAIAEAVDGFTDAELSHVGWLPLGEFTYGKGSINGTENSFAVDPYIPLTGDKFYIRVVTNKPMGDANNLIPEGGSRPVRALLVRVGYDNPWVNGVNKTYWAIDPFWKDDISIYSAYENVYDYVVSSPLKDKDNARAWVERVGVTDKDNARGDGTPDMKFTAYFRQGSTPSVVTKEAIFGNDNANDIFHHLDNTYVDDLVVGYNPESGGADVPLWGDGILGKLSSLIRSLAGLIVPTVEQLEAFQDGMTAVMDQLKEKMQDVIALADSFAKAFNNPDSLFEKTFTIMGADVQLVPFMLRNSFTKIRPFLTGIIVLFVLTSLYRRMTGSGDVIDS